MNDKLGSICGNIDCYPSIYLEKIKSTAIIRIRMDVTGIYLKNAPLRVTIWFRIVLS
jgi:hypothetical protein